MGGLDTSNFSAIKSSYTPSNVSSCYGSPRKQQIKANQS